MSGFGSALPCCTGLCETLLSQVTTDGPRVAEKGKVDHIPGVVFVAGRKYFKGIGKKRILKLKMVYTNVPSEKEPSVT